MQIYFEHGFSKLVHFSGAHLNPIVSFGVWIGGGMSFVLFMLFLTVQILGAFLGALLFRVRTVY